MLKHELLTFQQQVICGLFCHNVQEADVCDVAGARELH